MLTTIPPTLHRWDGAHTTPPTDRLTPDRAQSLPRRRLPLTSLPAQARVGDPNPDHTHGSAAPPLRRSALFLAVSRALRAARLAHSHAHAFPLGRSRLLPAASQRPRGHHPDRPGTPLQPREAGARRPFGHTRSPPRLGSGWEGSLGLGADGERVGRTPCWAGWSGSACGAGVEGTAPRGPPTCLSKKDATSPRRGIEPRSPA